MSNFLIYTNKLRQWVPSLSPEQAEDFINDAWRHIREANDKWSFLLAHEYWLSPSLITLAGIGVTKASADVVLTHANLLQVANLTAPPITQRQLKLANVVYEIASTDVKQVTDGNIVSTDQTLQCLTSAPFVAGDLGKKIVVAGAGVAGANLQTTIASVTGANEVELSVAASTTVVNATVTWGTKIILSRVYNEATTASASGALYRLYYSPTTTDFHRVDHITDPVNGREFGWDIEPIDDLDLIDPQRSSTGDPFRLYLHHFDTTLGLPVYEMWPGPESERAYTVTIWRLGTAFANDTDALPPQITEELLLLRARILAYEWGEANDADPRRRQSYGSLMMKAKSQYSTEGQPGRPLGLLDQAMRRDEEVALLQGRIRPRPSGHGWPVDTDFIQSHAIPPWWR